MIESDPSCDTWVASEIIFSIFMVGFPALDKLPSRGDVVFTNRYFVKTHIFLINDWLYFRIEDFYNLDLCTTVFNKNGTDL